MRFKVTIGRDATIYYSAFVEADNLDEVKEKVRRYGYAGDVVGEWELDSVRSFDDVESATITPESGCGGMTWNEFDGWNADD